MPKDPQEPIDLRDKRTKPLTNAEAAVQAGEEWKSRQAEERAGDDAAHEQRRLKINAELRAHPEQAKSIAAALRRVSVTEAEVQRQGRNPTRIFAGLTDSDRLVAVHYLDFNPNADVNTLMLNVVNLQDRRASVEIDKALAHHSSGASRELSGERHAVFNLGNAYHLLQLPEDEPKPYHLQLPVFDGETVFTLDSDVIEAVASAPQTHFQPGKGVVVDLRDFRK